MSERLSREELRSLLAGEGPSPVRDVLEAASAPARREELAGESAAVAAFLAARSTAPGPAAGPAAAPAGTSPADPHGTAATDPMTLPVGRRPRFGRRGPARLALAAVLGLATAGVATGATLTLHPAAPPPAPTDAGTSVTSSTRVALCRARDADPTTDPVAAALAGAAGGADRIAVFCAGVPAGRDGTPALGPGPRSAPGPATSTSASRTTTPGSATPSSPRPPADLTGLGSELDTDLGADASASTSGRAVGPPSTPPGRADGGRAVGPPATPPGRARSTTG